MQMIEKFDGKALCRGIRMSKEVGVLLIGCDARGPEFVERTTTVVLGRYSAGIVSMHRLGVEQALIVIPEVCDREAEIRVVGQISNSQAVTLSTPLDVGFPIPEPNARVSQ